MKKKRVFIAKKKNPVRDLNLDLQKQNIKTSRALQAKSLGHTKVYAKPAIYITIHKYKLLYKQILNDKQ